MYRQLTFSIGLALVLSLALASSASAELVAWWKMDETSGNVVADSSGNGIDGVLEGGAAIVNDPERGPVFQQNDVAANYVSIADPGGLLNFSSSGPHQGSATIAAWVKSAGTWTNHDAIFSQGEWDDGISLSIKGDTSPAGQLWLAGDGTHSVTFRSDVAVPTEGWHHVAATFAFDGANTVVTLYLDGQATGFSQGNGTIPGQVSAPVGGISRIGLEDRNGSAPRWPFNGSIDDVRIYDTALSQAEIQDVMAGKGGTPGLATDPFPDDKVEDVCPDVILSWTPGEFAATHNVYFGTDFDDVNTASIANPLGVLVSAGQDANTFDPDGLLAFGQTYYWRVDEVNAPPTSDTVFPGPVWSFTAELFAYPVEDVTVTASIPTSPGAQGPERTVDGSGLVDGQHSVGEGDMWLGSAAAGDAVWIQYDFDQVYKLYQMQVWNYNTVYEMLVGLGVKDVTIEYAAEPNEWITLGDFELPRGSGSPDYTGAAIDLAGIPARAVRININSSWGGQTQRFGLSELQFSYIPVYAREPQPASGTTDLDPAVVLSWRAGREAASHRVHLGTDPNAVADGTALVDTVAESRYDLPLLNLGTTYYWMITEVNNAAVPSAWSSEVWDFSTKEFLANDDFESYTDEPGSRLFDVWLDGFEVGGNGSQIGHNDQPYAERTIVHSGRQSAPVSYTNTEGVANSEIERTFASAQDWTAYGADTFSLYFHGEPIGFAEPAAGTIIMNGIGADIYSGADQGRFVYKQLSGNGTITARVESLDNTHEWAKAGVMIRETLDPSSAWAYVVWAGANGVRFQAKPTLGGGGTSDTPVATPEQIAVTAPTWIRLERAGDQFNGYYATDEAGTNWTAMVWNPQTIAMNANVFIGLAVTSHVASTVTQAVFSGVATTGNVTGQWQSSSMMVDQPAGNGIDALYLAIEDGAGRKVTLFHPDPYAVGVGTWTQWAVPLSDLSAAGVNVKAIKKFYLGVGDKTKPSQNASGVLYIDDIAFGRAASEE
ncbi:MAG: hypothetical protein JW993_14570 [Sedimentisphaerales bacterium]|nr:hypothetical protein [Sedimentisphaerales bacterium]